MSAFTRLTLVVATMAIPVVVAADPPAAEVDAVVRREMARQRIPGLSLGVVRDGRLVRAEGYGLANVELDAPVTPRTMFQSGSVSMTPSPSCCRRRPQRGGGSPYATS